MTVFPWKLSLVIPENVETAPHDGCVTNDTHSSSDGIDSATLIRYFAVLLLSFAIMDDTKLVYVDITIAIDALVLGVFVMKSLCLVGTFDLTSLFPIPFRLKGLIKSKRIKLRVQFQT